MNSQPSDRDTVALDPADRELEQLLSDTYDAPPAPRSLLKRIDRGVAAEWGQSPRPANGASNRPASRTSRWAKSLPVAGAIAAAILLMVILIPNSGNYSWAAMLEAMAQKGVVQVATQDGVRWLALSDGLLGEETAESSRVLDISQQVVLTRNTGEAEVRRQTLAGGSSAGDRDRLATAFLLGDGFSDWQRFDGLQVVDEDWEQVSNADRDEVVLRVRFRTSALEEFELAMTVDPESQLPVTYESPNSGATVLAGTFSYPVTDVAQLREQAIPAALEVVDVDDSGDTLVVTTNQAGGADPQDTLATTDPPMFGEASQWQPVAVVDRSGDDVLRQVDARLVELWEANDIEPTIPADDEELLRRVYLDLTGRTPTVHEVRAYLQDTSANRYEELVDRLLDSPDHASHLATVWRTFLIPEGVDLTEFGGVQVFDRWLAERFGDNVPYDQTVRDLLLAEGRLSRSGPLLFYSAVKLDPEQLASRTARVFLGMRLECAQCHDHPFEPWKQEEFWGFAAFFAQISRPRGTLESVSSVMRVHDVDHGEVMLPETETVVAPGFLNGAEFLEDEQEAARRVQLARWLTGADNPYFARATANRVWGHMFGRGIVDPVDDFGSQHQAKSPELVDLLAGHFINAGFDLRELFRTVALSRAYQLSSGAETVDERRLEFFAQMNVKTLTAEQMYDCITVATLLDNPSSGGEYAFNVDRIGNGDRDVFVQQFRTPAGRNTEYLAGIPQALTLMNGTLIEGATGLSSSGLLKSLEAPFFTNRQRIEVLYLATLSRQPRATEWELLEGYIPDDAVGAELQEGLSDILWALLNSAEFTLNH